jgi:hypothetical protein
MAQNEQTSQLAPTVAGSTEQPAGNSLGIDVGRISRQNSEAAGLAGAQIQSKTASSTEKNSPAVALKSDNASNNTDTPLLNLNAENQIPAEDTYGETVVGGMKVTLLNLDASEKEAVQSKVILT